MTERVTGLSGLTSARFTTGLPTILPIYATNCAGRASYGQPTPCPITGYVAAMTLSLEGQPAERGGDAVSIAAESGAKSARLTGLSLATDQIFRRQAAQAAMADAREQADIIARAAGRRVVGILQVQTPASVDRLHLEDGFHGGHVDANYAVATPITLVPGPISIESRLSVTFEIE